MTQMNPFAPSCAHRMKTVAVIAAIVSAAIAHSVSAQMVISEFMAKNDKTLVDGDGNYSDWIELYNMGESSVDLTSWYLSDDTNNLAKWAFPSKSIAAGDHLIVFASGQDETEYTDSLGYLHTTFKLSASGESVLLTQPDGVTIAHSFLAYPEQDDDISYGLAQDASYSTLVVEDQDATAFVGTSEPDDTWNTTGFNDSGWTSGQTGVGYDKGSTYSSMINLDLESSMFIDGMPPTIYDSAYIRVAFSLDDAAIISQLALRMKYDDGFVAYINGTEVASANVPDSPTYSSTAPAEHTGTAYEDYTLLNAGDYLQTGDNVLAIHGINNEFDPRSGSTGDPDFFIMPVLSGITIGDIQTNSAMYFSTPTPEADNVFGVLGYVGDTAFTVDRGFFTNAFDVEISCNTAGSEIYYTVDGTAPTTDNGTRYASAITINKTTVLRAAAFITGYQPSDVDTQTYIFLADVITQGTSVTSLDPYFPPSAVNGQGFDYGMDTAVTESSTYSSQIKAAMTAIPSISIVTDPDNLFDTSSGIYVNADQEGEAWEREMSVELINPDGTDGFQINGGMRIRGESSTLASNPKHSFRFLFKSEYGISRLNYSLFGDEGANSYKRMDLRTGQNFSWANQYPAYATWLYDIFTRDTHRDMNQPYTRGEYYHLYINGMYWGLYQTEERCDSRFAESYYGDDNDDFDAVKADGDTGDMYAVDGTRDAYEDLWTGMSAGVSGNADYFELQGMNSDGTENSSYTKLLDIDNVIDYMLLIYFTANRDSPIGPPNQNTMPRNVTTVYNRANPDGFKYVSHDNEHSLEIQEGVNHNRFTQSLSSTFDGIDKMTPWWMHLKLMNNAEYALRFADHVHEHFFNNGALSATETANRLVTRKNEIYAAVVAESARWGDSAGTLRTRDDDWLTQANWLLYSYMPYRSGIVLGQIESKGWYPTVAAPEFNQHGGSIASGFSLSISGTNTIYYTTDGSDPREVGGSAVGTTYGSAIPLTKSTQVKARILSGGTWSALTKATFVLDEASPLRVTEIMYHPAAGTSGSETNYSASNFEFIELFNTSDETIGLAGTQFSEGIVFDFTDGDEATVAPGDYIVLVNDRDAFAERYTNWANINIAGEFHGKFFIQEAALDNAGEPILLQDGLGKPILSFEYNDAYDITDGDGYSLTLIDSSADTNTWSDSASWRPSKYTGGTPGSGPANFPSPDDLVINEALTHQDHDDPGDWVELYNGSTNTIDINGWYLSDDDTNLMKVALSGLSTIAPGGYLILTEYDHFGTLAAGANGFALSELGDSIYVSSAEGGVLTGYRLDEDFDGADRDVTFGRYVKSDGSSDFPAQSSTTSGSENATPRVGPIVISEIHYHPADSNGYEFVELYNTASSNVPLYDVSIPTNTWRLDGAVAFSFPVSQTMAPDSYLIICETNASAFASFYTVPTGTTVLGPYDGKLSNDGESLRLERPGDPEALTGEIPEILVERVVYDNESPWPTNAAGGGYSLRRLEMSEYGNDSINWSRSSSDPTPGMGDTNPVGSYMEMTVAGTFNGWDALGANMTLTDNFTWEWTAILTNETSVAFKFAADGAWDSNWGDNNPAGQDLPLSGISDSFGSNIVVNGTLEGVYVFTYNDRTRIYGLEGIDADADSDGDGMTDAWEWFYGGTPTGFTPSGDADGDDLLNIDEYLWGTNPVKADTDDDGLNDGAEVNTYGTDPLKSDSDGDGITDGDEVNTYGTDPLDADSFPSVANDFNGDGASDLMVLDQQTGRWFARSVDGEQLAYSVNWGWSGVEAVAGDYDGDGIGDLAVFDQNTGRWFIRAISGEILAWDVNWGWPGVEPVSGDFDGDGMDDLAIFDQNTGRWFIRSISGDILAWNVYWGWPGVQPISGDYDGDGVDDLAILDQNTGRWFVRTLAGDILAWQIIWGWDGVMGVSGDFDGDAQSDLAVFDVLTGRWFIRNISGDILAWDVNWGWSSVSPVSGDFDGDGVSDLSVFDDASGRWFIRSLAGEIIGWDINWGWAGVQPVGR